MINLTEEEIENRINNAYMDGREDALNFYEKYKAFSAILSAYENCEGDMEYLGHSVEHIIHKYLRDNKE